MSLLFQNIKTKPRQGATTALKAMALGFAMEGFKTAIILPTQEYVLEFKKRNPDFGPAGTLELMSAQQMVQTVLKDRNRKQFQCFLLDDCHLMQTSEGHPLALLEHRFKHTAENVCVIGFSKVDADENPNP
ncbi:hypothetical protein AB0539_004487 [Vibrio parahaemolyticus]